MADDIVSQYYLANALRQGQRPSPRSILAQRMMGNALDTSPTTPLGALAVLAEAASMESDPASIQRLMQRMEYEAHRLTSMVDDVLALYERWGRERYDEELSQLDHAVQTAALAVADGAPGTSTNESPLAADSGRFLISRAIAG